MILNYDKELLNASYYVDAINSILSNPMGYAREFYDNYDNLVHVSKNNFVKPTEFLYNFLVPDVISQILLGTVYNYDISDFDKLEKLYQENHKIFPIEYLLADIDKLDYSFNKYLSETDKALEELSEDDISEFAEHIRFSEGFESFYDKLVNDTSQQLAQDPKVLRKVISALDYKHFFKPRARLLLQLGNQLIKDEGLALFELVKNSYDADATYSNVQLNYIDKKDLGQIIIEDNGSGMNYDLITNHWLEPGTDVKEQQIEKFERSSVYGRLPLGEKGIGRFGSHKLGQVIQLVTKTDFDDEVEINIDWKSFESVKYLDEAPIDIVTHTEPTIFKKSLSKISKKDMDKIKSQLNTDYESKILNDFYKEENEFFVLTKNVESDSEESHKNYSEIKKVLNRGNFITSGTYIKVTNLWENWTRGMLRNTFRAVNAINSPFSEKDNDFLVEIETTKESWLNKLLTTEEAINKSLFIAKGYIEGEEIHLEYEFKPYSNMDKLKGRYTKDKFFLETIEKVYDESTNTYKKKKVGFTLDEYQIGKVNFEFYMYDLSPKVLDYLEFDKSGFKKFLKANGGIRVYRDKVRVYDYGEPGNDWLNLDYKRLTSPTQAISNNQILGAIYLDREYSSDLVEKTNREGFVSNLAYETFAKAILVTIEKIAQERVIDKTMIKDTYGANRKSEPVISTIKELDQYIDSNISDTHPAKKKIREKLIEIEREYLSITENLLTAAGSGLSLNIAVHEIEKIIMELIKKVDEDNLDKDVSHLVNNLHTTLKHYAELSKFHKNEKISLQQTIESAIDLNTYRLYSHNIELINNSKNIKEDIKVKFTKKLLLASIANILDNAIFWLDDKESYLSHDDSTAFKKKIYIDILLENDIPSVIIADNGYGFKIGTDMAKKPYITKKDGSMGLGLYIIDETMKMHKGQLLFPEKGDIDLPEEFENGAVIQLKFEKRI